jgi:hypothetical protein
MSSEEPPPAGSLPGDVRDQRCHRRTVPDSDGVGRERIRRRRLTLFSDLGRNAVVQRCRRVEPDARMTVHLVVVLEEFGAERRESSIEPNRSGNSGQYLRVLNAASEKGLSLVTWGRLWLRATPRSMSNCDTG